MVFAILFSLLFLFLLFAGIYFYYSFTNHNPKEGISEQESSFILSTEGKSNQSKVAVVKCSKNRETTDKVLQYSKMIDCRVYLDKYGYDDFCKYGCLGYGTCVSVCPEHAIIIQNNTAVVTDKCSGCGICVDKCPQNIIELIDKNATFKQCAVQNEKENESCSGSCIFCKKCDSPDFKVEYCPHMCIKKSPIIQIKGFKFWDFWYKIFHRIGE